MAVKLGTSFDVVEAVRSLATDQQSLQEIVAALDSRLQVLEGPAAPRPLVQVGTLVADEDQPGAGVPGPEVAASPTEKPLRRVKGEAQVGRTDRKA